MRNLYKNYQFEGIITIIIGIILMIIPEGVLKVTLQIGIGVTMIVLHLPSALTSLNRINRTKSDNYYMISSWILTLLGLITLFFGLDFVGWIIGVIMIIIILISILMNIHFISKADIIKYVVSFIIAVCLILAGFDIFITILKYIIGTLLIIYGIYKVFFINNNLKKKKNTNTQEKVIDVDFHEEK